MLLQQFSRRSRSEETTPDRLLWAVGPLAAKIPPGHTVGDRYQVIAPQVWKDTQPEKLPEVPETMPAAGLPYLHLHGWRLHLPEVYGFCQWAREATAHNILLLENAPFDLANGRLQPPITEAWALASPLQQMYWLWQMLELWQPLAAEGVAASLLDPENVRVRGWRIWLLELYDRPEGAEGVLLEGREPQLADLAYHWLTWTGTAADAIAQPLKQICLRARDRKTPLEAIAADLNGLLLRQAAGLPLKMQAIGATETGNRRDRNEDACFPTAEDLRDPARSRGLVPFFSIVCDGLGGHEGGEVASELATKTIAMQARNLLAEIEREPEPLPPQKMTAAIAAILRVANNLIASQNDLQGRSSRQRMGTTVTIALQVPQKISLSDGLRLENAHELYIANIGDSRAYWISEDDCLQLTADDDLGERHVRAGKQTHRQAALDPGSGSLTQALGTREGERLHPNIRRFLITEDCLLLLCSDGISDRDLVPRFWKQLAPPVLSGEISLETAVQEWLQLANEENGHDNTSIVLVRCSLAAEPLVLFEPGAAEPAAPEEDSDMAASSKALLDVEAIAERRRKRRRKRDRKTSKAAIAAIFILLMLAGSLFAWWRWQSLPGKSRPNPTEMPIAPDTVTPESVIPESEVPGSETAEPEAVDSEATDAEAAKPEGAEPDSESESESES